MYECDLMLVFITVFTAQLEITGHNNSYFALVSRTEVFLFTFLLTTNS